MQSIQNNLDKQTILWIQTVISCIKEIQNDFNNNKGLLLTEGDLECELYRRLNNKPIFSKRLKCINSEWRTGFIHSQVTWFKPDRESGFEVDLTLLNPSKLDIQTFELAQQYPNKGFFYDGEAVAIELKFLRDNKEGKISNDAQSDYIKIIDELRIAKENLISNKKYFQANMNNVGFIVVVGCKTEDIYDFAITKLEYAMSKRPCPKNVIPIIFSHSKIEIFNQF
jgi:hypothetical protein